MSSEKRTYKIYGMKPHELTVEMIDEIRQQIFFDGYAIATNWTFNDEPMEQLIKAIKSDKIFATRWEFYAKQHKSNEYANVFKPLLDPDGSKIIDDDAVEIMNGFIALGLPSGLSAFLTVINSGQKNPLTVDDISWIQQTGAVIQMDSTTYESTLEIVALLRQQWNQKSVEGILQKFGRTLQQQQDIYNIMSKISPETASSVPELNSPTIHFLASFSSKINELHYTPEKVTLLIELLSQISSEDSFTMDKIQKAWTAIINNNGLLSKPVSSMTEEEQKAKEKIDESLTLFKMKTMNFSEYTKLASLWHLIGSADRYSSSSASSKQDYAGLLFSSVVAIYGGNQIIETMENHKSSAYGFWHYLTLFEYEKDGTIADPNLVFSLLGLQ